MLVAQDRVPIDHFRRLDNGAWLMTSASKPEDAIDLSALGCSIPLAEIYAGVSFDPQADARTTEPASESARFGGLS